MKNRKNRTQRQEVRRILAAMRTELQEYRLHYEDMPESCPMVHLNEVISRAKESARSQISDM